MPEEKASGMLVSPMGSPVLPLGEYQYKELATCLSILEGSSDIPRELAFSRALRHLLDIYRTGKTLSDSASDSPKGVLAGQIGWWLAEHECSDCDRSDFYGVLYQRHGAMHTLTEEEETILGDALAAIREGGWFKQWLSIQVAVIAKGKMPDDRHPSPHKIAGSLVLDITEWQDELDSAKQFAEMRPDLLFPVMRCEGDSPAAPEGRPPAFIPPVTKPKPRRARKGHKHKAA